VLSTQSRRIIECGPTSTAHRAIAPLVSSLAGSLSAPRNTHQPPPPRLLCLLCSAPRGGEDGGPGRWSSPAAAQPPTVPPKATAAPTLRRTVRAARHTLRLCCLSNELSRDGISPPSPASGCICIPNPVETRICTCCSKMVRDFGCGFFPEFSLSMKRFRTEGSVTNDDTGTVLPYRGCRSRLRHFFLDLLGGQKVRGSAQLVCHLVTKKNLFMFD
jgi:hypothetical protein